MYIFSTFLFRIYIYMKNFEKSKTEPISVINSFIFEIKQTPLKSVDF